MIKVALVDDHLLVRNGIKSLLEEDQSIQVIAEGNNGIEAIDLVADQQPDILVIDVRMPLMDGIEAVKNINKTDTKTQCIVLSMHDSEEYIIKAIEAGAKGYLLKDTGKNEFLKAIKMVYNGGKYFSGDISDIIMSHYVENKKSDNENSKTPSHGLTKKEIEILQLILTGKTNQEIADELDKSKRTIETHRFNLMKKLQVKNLIELTRKANELNL